MGIAKYLKVGRISVNPAKRQIEICEGQLILPYDKLTESDWGSVYEKFVGQQLEDEGFDVIYNGLEKGMLDRGIDLIASKGNEINFIQCKYLAGSISKSRIDWILYKASNQLYNAYKSSNNKLSFTLIVNNKEKNFSKRKRKKFRLNFSDMTKVEYPMLQFFLDHNHIQDKVKLAFREIEMI